MPEKPRCSISRAISRVWRRRPGTATRLIAGIGSGIGRLLCCLRGDLHRIGAVAVAERRGVDFFELDFAVQYPRFPCILLGHSGMELGHYVSGEEFEAFADMLMRILASLVQQNNLVDMRRLEPPQLAPQCLRRADQAAS